MSPFASPEHVGATTNPMRNEGVVIAYLERNLKLTSRYARLPHASTRGELRQAIESFQEVTYLLNLYGMNLTKTEEQDLGKVSIVLVPGKFSLDGVSEIKRAWRIDD